MVVLGDVNSLHVVLRIIVGLNSISTILKDFFLLKGSMLYFFNKTYVVLGLNM